MIKRNPPMKRQGVFNFFSSLFTKNSTENVLTSRPPRVKINRLHAVSFDMETPQKQIGLGVANISHSGIGFLAGHSQWPHPGDYVKGTLNILEYKLPATLRVIHVTSVVAGCQFSAIGQEYSEVLSQYFVAEFDAIQLSKVNSAYIKGAPDGIPLWFKGLDNSELYFVHRDNQIISFIITFLGSTITWSESSEFPQYGVLHNDDGENVQLYGKPNNETSTLYDPSGMNTTAIKFIHNISGLSRGFTDQIESILLKFNIDDTI